MIAAFCLGLIYQSDHPCDHRGTVIGFLNRAQLGGTNTNVTHGGSSWFDTFSKVLMRYQRKLI